MGTYLDYLSWRGDLDFLKDPFNEVDNLILAELAYTKMEQIVPGIDRGETVPIREICRMYEEKGYKAEGSANDAYPLLRRAADSTRFAGVEAGAYVNLIDAEKSLQFSAVSFFLPDGSCYVAFRGTDNTIVGWKEDFTISYLSETPGQYEAVRYLERIAARTRGALRVGGHSKGGNLAVYAAAFSDQNIWDRILTVYSNDGPGFNSSVTASPEYQLIQDKISLIIPESSLIGILLFNKKERKVVRSTASGMRQHDPYTWEVMGPSFVETEAQSQTSLFLDETLDRWVEQLNTEQRANLVKVIFDSMDATGSQTFTELNAKRLASYNAIFKAILSMDPSLQKDVMKTAQKLLATAGCVFREDAEVSLKEALAQLMDMIGSHT